MSRAFFLASFTLFACSMAACDGGSGGGTGGSAGDGGSGGGATTTTPGGSSAGGSGGSTSSSQGGGGAAPGLVQVFVAQGHMGRTTRSCDDGKTWIDDQSQDDSVICFDPLDCDHNSGAGRGLAFGDGQWVATFGWGAPGTVRTSKDGASWDVVVDPAPNFADVAFGDGVFVANSRPPQLSTDGETWVESPSAEMLDVWNPRAIAFIPDQGLFVITGESGQDRDMVLSNDGGQSWWHPDSRPPECVSYVRGITGGNGAIVAASGNGFVCTSTDGGKTWVKVDVAEGLSSPPVFTGAEILVWQGDTVFRSADGLIWTSEPISPQGISIGPVTRGSNGTFVAANDGWMVWYEKQQFFRSTDGVTWEVLDKSKFKGSHPINFIEAGWAEPTAECPLPPE